MIVLQQVFDIGFKGSSFVDQIAKKVLVNKWFRAPHALPEAGHVGLGRCWDGSQEVEVEINNYPRGGGLMAARFHSAPEGGGSNSNYHFHLHLSPPPGDRLCSRPSC